MLRTFCGTAQRGGSCMSGVVPRQRQCRATCTDLAVDVVLICAAADRVMHYVCLQQLCRTLGAQPLPLQRLFEFLHPVPLAKGPASRGSHRPCAPARFSIAGTAGTHLFFFLLVGPETSADQSPSGSWGSTSPVRVIGMSPEAWWEAVSPILEADVAMPSRLRTGDRHCQTLSTAQEHCREVSKH